MSKFTKPAMHSDPGEYDRVPPDLTYDVTQPINFRTDVAVPYIEVLGPGNVQLWKGDGNNVTIPANTLTVGGFHASAPDVEPFAFTTWKKGAPPFTGPLLPMCQGQSMEETRSGSNGCHWVSAAQALQGAKGNKLAKRPFAQITKVPNTPDRRKQVWVQPVCAGDGVWSDLPRVHQNERGTLSIGRVEQYFRPSAQGFSAGNFSEGPYGIGELGSAIAGRQRKTDGAVLITSINGMISYLYDDGRIERVWGWKLPAGVAMPRLSNSTVLTEAQKLAWVRSQYEYVGDAELLNPFFAMPHPWNHYFVIIWDTDHHNVRIVDIRTHTTVAVIGAPDGTMGWTPSGVGENVRMRRPRGGDYVGEGDWLTINQAWNGSIGDINLKTYEYRDRWRSRKNWDTEGNTLGTNFHGMPLVDIRALWQQDGKSGEGVMLHPQNGSYNSLGNYVTFSDHTREGYEWNPETGIVKKLFTMPEAAGGFVEQYQRHTGWGSLDVNKDGVDEMKDVILVSDWGAVWAWKRDGTTAFNPCPDPTRPGTMFGTMDRIDVMGYPWGSWFVPLWGGFMLSDNGSERVLKYTARLPEDVDISDADYTAGYALWRAPYQGGLAPASLFDDVLFSQIGDATAQDMASWAKVEVLAWLEARFGDWTEEELEAVYKYIKSCQLPPFTGEVVPVPVPAPEFLEYTVDGVSALGVADLQVSVNPGQIVVVVWRAKGDSMNFNGETVALSGTKNWKAPADPGIYPLALNVDTADGQTSAKLVYFTVKGVIAPPPPPDPTPVPTPTPTPGAYKFVSVALLALDTLYKQSPKPPKTGKKGVTLLLHGTGGNEGIYGDLYEAQCGPELGGNDVPTQRWRVRDGVDNITIAVCDPGRTPANPIFRTFHLGWATTRPAPIYPYTEWRYLAILEWAKLQYPFLDWADTIVTGNSMGACGAMYWGLRHPEIFAAAKGTGSRFHVMGFPSWDGGRGQYKNFNTLSSMSDTVPAPHALYNGADYQEFADVIKGILDPNKEMPFLYFSWSGDDTSGLMNRFYECEAIRALQAAERGYATAWNSGGHATCSRPMERKLTPTYSGLFKLGVGYPVLMNCSLDDDPETTDEGGINVGFEWRSVTENAQEFLFEIRQRNDDCTVTIKPYSKVFKGREKKNISLVKDVWKTVHFEAAVEPVITHRDEQQDVPCGAGMTGVRHQTRTVTITDGVEDNPAWVEVSNTCAHIPDVQTRDENRDVPCAPGYVGKIHQTRTVVITDGVENDPPWIEVSNTCKLPAPEIESFSEVPGTAPGTLQAKVKGASKATLTVEGAGGTADKTIDVNS